MSSPPILVSQSHCFGGTTSFYRHPSQVCNSEMRFSVYLPPQAATQRLPVLYFLSGLTCTEENMMVKAGSQRYAAEVGVILVAPDTSPRHTGIPNETAAWDLGAGAGFYVNATTDPWRQHYHMYDYVVSELPALIHEHFPVLPERQGIFGHSMGGHGALVCALRHPERYRSVSAFAPIGAPMQCPWGQNAFRHYLGEDTETWRAYDASQLLLTHRFPTPILIDQGLGDSFLSTQLMPEALEDSCQKTGQPLILRRHPDYDHSYYFIATFMADHIRHHAALLSDSNSVLVKF